MWVKKLSLAKPEKEEIINGVLYKRRDIKNVYSTLDNTVYWSYEEEAENTEEKALEIIDQISELEKQLKELGVVHNETRS